jgi:hypothetical protein
MTCAGVGIMTEEARAMNIADETWHRFVIEVALFMPRLVQLDVVHEQHQRPSSRGRGCPRIAQRVLIAPAPWSVAAQNEYEMA